MPVETLLKLYVNLIRRNKTKNLTDYDMLPSSRTMKYKNLLGGISMSRRGKVSTEKKIEL